MARAGADPAVQCQPFPLQLELVLDYGGGELPNNGVHLLDMARLGLGVDSPATIASSGGNFVYDDAQETPDTQSVAFEFPGTVLLWEHRCWSNFGLLNEEGPVRIGGGVIWYGDKDTFNDKGWQVTVDGKVVESRPGDKDSELLVRNFVACVKSRRMSTVHDARPPRQHFPAVGRT